MIFPVRTHALTGLLLVAIAPWPPLRADVAQAGSAAPSTASASPTTRASLPDPTLDRLVAEALEGTPELVSARANLEAARRRIAPAGTLPDPSLSTTYQNDGRSLSLGKAEGSFFGLMLSQPLPWPGKLGLASSAARSEAREIETGFTSRTARTIEARVRNAWYDLVLARSLDRLIEDRRETARQIEATVRDRYAAGLAVQQDVIRAQIELARIDESKAVQHATIVSRLAEIDRLLGRAQDAPLDTPADLPLLAPLPAGQNLVAGVARSSPEMAAAQQGVETARIRVDMARRNFLPDFVVSGGSMYRGSFEMGPMWQVGVGVSLPIWQERRQQNQLAEAKARIGASTADADVVRRELELRTRERIAQLEAAMDVAALYHDKILPLDDLSLESALASYRAGKVPFLTVFEAVSTLYSDRSAYLSRLAEAAKWRVAIDEGSLQPTAMSAGSALSIGPSMGSASSAIPAAQQSGSSNSMSSMR